MIAAATGSSTTGRDDLEVGFICPYYLRFFYAYVIDSPVFMRLFPISSPFLQWAFYTTSASSLRSDRCRRSTVQTPRASTARGHLPMSANATALAPCGAHRPIGCCCQKRKSSCDFFSNWQTETNGRFEGSAATCRQQEHRGH